MKLKHHLWIAFGIIIIALFLTSVVSVIEVAGLVEKSETNTSIWGLMFDNLFTKIPTNDLIDDLAKLGLDSVTATALIEKHGMGNSLVSGLLGLLPVLAAFAGVLLVTFKENIKKWVIYTSFGLVALGTLTIWFTAPTKLNPMETLFNELSMPLGTMMKEGTTISLGLGFFVILAGSLYGIVALVLNKYGKIQE